MSTPTPEQLQAALEWADIIKANGCPSPTDKHLLRLAAHVRAVHAGLNRRALQYRDAAEDMRCLANTEGPGYRVVARMNEAEVEAYKQAATLLLPTVSK